MKDYSNWKVYPDYENDSPWVDPNRPWVKNRPTTIAKTITYDPIPMPELIKLAIEKFPNNVCVYDKVLEKKYTYRELGHYASRIANALYELGVRKGDGVAIMSANCPEFFFCSLGIQLSGAMAIPVNALLKEDDVVHIVKTSGNVKVFFVHSANYRTVKKARKQVEIENMILLGSEEAKENTITFTDFIEGELQDAPKA
jgi:acyl-CoA synthetase (AMP-forming)/AMP-acid ligase II